MTVLSSRFFIENGVKDESGMMKCDFNAKSATKFNLVAGKMRFLKKLRIIAVIFLVIIFLILTLKYIAGTQYRRYDRLELEVPFAQVMQSMGEADFTCFYNDKMIVYYCDPTNPFAHNPPKDMANYSKINNIKEIPDIYGAIQIMIGASGKVEAYTWNGEALKIYTIHGNVKNATFQNLDKKYFE